MIITTVITGTCNELGDHEDAALDDVLFLLMLMRQRGEKEERSKGEGEGEDVQVQADD